MLLQNEGESSQWEKSVFFKKKKECMPVQARHDSHIIYIYNKYSNLIAGKVIPS